MAVPASHTVMRIPPAAPAAPSAFNTREGQIQRGGLIVTALWIILSFWIGGAAGFFVFAALQVSRDGDARRQLPAAARTVGTR